VLVFAATPTIQTVDFLVLSVANDSISTPVWLMGDGRMISGFMAGLFGLHCYGFDTM
jgi:hypothetical protein